MIFSGGQDKRNMEGVGLAHTNHATATMWNHQAVSSRVLAAKFLTKSRSSAGCCDIFSYWLYRRERPRFYSDLDCVMSNGNRLAMVMGDFNASVSERAKRDIGPYGLGRHTSDNSERLVSFASANGMCMSNTFFTQKHIHQASWYPHPATKIPAKP